ncbi:transposase, partial [Francisella tularensis]|uniref:transposase n=1 Tax=Francisella tularensis TaxID=263 RepID=UPI0029665A86
MVLHTTHVPNLRLFIEVVFYMLSTRCQWMLLPFSFGKSRTLHKRFTDWCDSAIFSRLF